MSVKQPEISVHFTSDENSVPDVYLNGERIDGLIEVDLKWATKTSDYQGIKNIYLCYLTKSDDKVVKHEIFKDYKTGQSEYSMEEVM